ncbi:MAG TPA: MFS transporter [Candidatus Limnocylindrales bacterium]|nr:MFS transporter [Candidatus Limnocylindrales bacterium]
MDSAPSAEPRTTTPASVLRPAIVYSILFGAQGAYLPYVSIFLASTGLDLGTVGAFIALYACVSLVAAPSWGAVADALGDVRVPVLAAAIASAAATGLLAVAETPLTIGIATAVLAAAFAGIIPMVDSQAVRLVGQRDRFGLARAPGSGAFVVIAFATGAILGATGPRGMFLVYAPLTLLIGVAAWWLLRLPPASGSVAAPRRGTRVAGLAGRALGGLSPAAIVGVLRAPSYGPFFVACVLIWTSHAMLQSFVSLRIVALGGDAPVVAATWSLGALLEVVLMSSFPWLARRVGTERLIVIGALGFAARAGITAVATDPLVIVLASLFGGVGFSFVYVGAVTWVAATVDRRTQATAQGIFTGTANGMGAIGGSILGGAIGGAFSLPVLFGVAAVGYALGGLGTWRAIGRRRPAGAGTPLPPEPPR